MNHSVLWVYIGLLIGGGMAGYFKAGSKISLVMSLAFAVLLGLCNVGTITPFYVSYILIGLLLIVFLMRLVKTRKFMPSGLMVLLSAATLGILLAI